MWKHDEKIVEKKFMEATKVFHYFLFSIEKHDDDDEFTH